MRDKLLSAIREASLILTVDSNLIHSKVPLHFTGLVELKVCLLDPDLSFLSEELQVTLSFYSRPYFLRIPYRSILSFKKGKLS